MTVKTQCAVTALACRTDVSPNIVCEHAARRIDTVDNIRASSGRLVNRAEIIRALIDGLIDSGMDITSSGSESDLRARVARRLGSSFR